jgi:hypothetical protein
VDTLRNFGMTKTFWTCKTMKQYVFSFIYVLGSTQFCIDYALKSFPGNNAATVPRSVSRLLLRSRVYTNYGLVLGYVGNGFVYMDYFTMFSVARLYSAEWQDDVLKTIWNEGVVI